MADNTYDLIVIGAGPGGYVAAIRAAQLGLKVIVVEREHMGGICLNWGCIPTKAMLRSSEVYHLMNRATEFGLSAQKIDFDLAAVVARSRGIAKQLNDGVSHLLKKNKVTCLMGVATIKERGQVVVKTAKSNELLIARDIIIATGARARELSGLEGDGNQVWTYKTALAPPRMPKKLLVIGSGAIGIEFASFYNTLGAETVVVEMMDQVLPVEDAEISKFAQKSFEKQGIKIKTNAMVKKLERLKGSVKAHIEQNGKSTIETFDTVISAVGIVGNVEELGLESLGIKTEN
jgi:dihydrolipoamide dehydrogenase